MDIRINTLSELQAYLRKLANANDMAYYYLDANYYIEERLEHFYNNVNAENLPALVFSVFDTKLVKAGTSITSVIIAQIMVLKKLENEATDPTALETLRAETWDTTMALKGTIMLDQQETWEAITTPAGKPIGYGKWWLETMEGDDLMPESDIANSGAYGWLMDLNVAFSANYNMFN